MRVKSAVFALVISFLVVASGCGKKPEVAPATNASTTDSSKGAATSESAKESAKPPSLMERLTSKPVTVPEGTVLTVRLNETVSSKNNNSGDKFTGTVEEPVEVGGKVVIPKGSTVGGTVTEAKALGKIKGGATLRQVLDSVTIGD